MHCPLCKKLLKIGGPLKKEIVNLKPIEIYEIYELHETHETHLFPKLILNFAIQRD